MILKCKNPDCGFEFESSETAYSNMRTKVFLSPYNKLRVSGQQTYEPIAYDI